MTPAPLSHPRPAGLARPLGMLLATASLALLVMPFFTSFGDLLTRLAMAAGIDAALGHWIAPAEAHAVRGALALFGLRAAAEGSLLTVSDGVRGVTLYISWNCVGWQTLLFLGVSMLTGLQGEYTIRSRIETAILGVCGIILFNILRITTVAIVAFAFGQLPAIIVHDYGSILATVAFLVAFWIFAYNVLLERRGEAGSSPIAG